MLATEKPDDGKGGGRSAQIPCGAREVGLL